MKINAWHRTTCLVIFVSAMIGTVAPVRAQTETAGAKKSNSAEIVPLLTRPLSGIAGKEGAMLTVEYAPGASSAKHRHNAHVFVYVLEGSLMMQAEGAQAVTLVAGQTFYESPSDIHAVSKNASATERAKFVVFFVKDEGTPFVIPIQ